MGVSGQRPRPAGEMTYKPRRTHTKSRDGCVRCKQGRRKCDELKPHCSRCRDRMLCCQYPERTFKDALLTRPSYDQALLQTRKPGTRHQGAQMASPRSHASQYQVATSPASNPTTEEPLHSTVESVFGNPLDLITGFATPLSRMELDLLSHYLGHTARAVSFDTDDLYALQVGIPSLAKHSKPLLSSIIALAAICKCNDIVRETGTHLHDSGLLYGLLALADRHHKASLRQTQEDIASADHYDPVLANAPLMVLYASASHSVRIRFGRERVDKEGVKADSSRVEFAPAQSQWIPLIRAAHLAYTGLLGAPRPRVDAASSMVGSSLATYSPASSRHLIISRDDTTALAEDGPSSATEDLLLPIIASTSGPALQRLRKWMLTTTETRGTSPYRDVKNFSDTDKLAINIDVRDIRACFEALDTLDRVLSDVFSRKNSSSLPQETHSGPSLEVCPQSLLSEVSPWLRTYLASVTSDRPTNQPLRRTIMFFLNRVPTRYLDLVQTRLGAFSEQDDRAEVVGSTSPFTSPLHGAASHLALTVFAHWLVLVMLLDGVWWIGDIGAWELDRIVSFMRRQPRQCSVMIDENWWPESMLNIARDIRDRAV